MAEFPAFVCVSNSWIVDHTSVSIPGDATNQAHFGCMGTIADPLSSGTRNVFGELNDLAMNLKLAKFIASFSDEDGGILDRSFYNRNGSVGSRCDAFKKYGDCCGLKYGKQGVCHTMANRLMLASNHPFRVVNADVGGLGSISSKISSLFYGFYGKRGMKPFDNSVSFSWAQYNAICLYVTSLTTPLVDNVKPLGLELNTAKIEELTKKYISDFKTKLRALPEPKIGDHEGILYKMIMQYELDHLEEDNLRKDCAKIIFNYYLSGSESKSMVTIFADAALDIDKIWDNEGDDDTEAETSALIEKTEGVMQDFLSKTNKRSPDIYKKLFNCEYTGKDELIFAQKWKN